MGGGLEVEQHVVWLGPQRLTATWEEGMQRGARVEIVGGIDEPRQQLGERPPYSRIVRVEVLTLVPPFLECRAAANAERARAREAPAPDALLNLLHCFEIVILYAIGVHLQRDARAVRLHEPEQRSHADLEGEALDGVGTELNDALPDLFRLSRPEDLELDATFGPHMFCDELTHS